MGDIDKYARVILAASTSHEQKISDLEEVIETLKNTISDMNEQIQSIKQVNVALEETLKNKAQETSDKTIIENQELEGMQNELFSLHLQIEKLQKIESSLLDKLKQRDEAVEDKSQTIVKLKSEIMEMAETSNSDQKVKDKLKLAYNTIYQKYLNLKKSYQEEIQRLSGNYNSSNDDISKEENNQSESDKKIDIKSPKNQNMVSTVAGESIENTESYNQQIDVKASLESQLEQLQQSLNTEKIIMEEHMSNI